MTMDVKTVIAWSFLILSATAGLGLLLAVADEDKFKQVSKCNPLARLFRYRGFRYLVAGICFCMAIIAYLTWLA